MFYAIKKSWELFTPNNQNFNMCGIKSYILNNEKSTFYKSLYFTFMQIWA